MWLALSLTLVACGDTDDANGISIATLRTATPQPDNAPSACRLMTRQEAEGILGPLQLIENQDPSICLYHGEKAVISVTTREFDSATAEDDFAAQLVEQGGTKIDGVGDSAFWVPVARKIYVRFGAYQVEISVPHTLNLDESLALLIRLAAASGERLGA